MRIGRASVSATIVLILATALISGPMVGQVDFTPTADSGTGGTTDFNPGQGSVDVTVISAPETAMLKSSRFGAGTYTLQMGSMRVSLSNVTGQPILVYKIEISKLELMSGTSTFLNESSAGQMTVPFRGSTIEGSQVDSTRDAYNGRLIVGVLVNGSERTVYQQNVTVEVNS